MSVRTVLLKVEVPINIGDDYEHDVARVFEVNDSVRAAVQEALEFTRDAGGFLRPLLDEVEVDGDRQLTVSLDSEPIAQYKVIRMAGAVAILMTPNTAELVASALEIVNPDDPDVEAQARNLAAAIGNEV